MRKSIDELIGEIRMHAHGRVDSVHIDPMLDEVRSHLDASVGSRMELGTTTETALKETIAEFGDPVEFAKKMAIQHPIYRNRLFDKSSTIAMITGLVLYSIFQAVDRINAVVYPLAIPFLVGAGLIAFWITATGWRARLLPVFSVVAVFLFGIPLLASVNALSWLPGQSQRVLTENSFVRAEANVHAALKAQSDFAASANKNLFGMNGAPKMKIIWRRSPDDRPDTFQLAPAATPAEATATWQKVLPRAYSALAAETLGARHNMSFAAEDLNKSYLQHLVSGVTEAAGSSGAITFGMLYFSALGWLTRYLKRSVTRAPRQKELLS